MRRRPMAAEVLDILMRLAAAGFLGACIGFERRVHHKAIGIAGMVLIAIGSTTYMLLGRHFADADPSSISRTLQGFLSGIGFLGGAVVFKSGFEVKGIKAAAAIWITRAVGLAIAPSYWWLGSPGRAGHSAGCLSNIASPMSCVRRSRKPRITTRTERNE